MAQASDMAGYHVGHLSSEKCYLKTDEEVILYSAICQNEYNVISKYH